MTMLHDAWETNVTRALGEVTLDDDPIEMSRPSTPEAQIRRPPVDMRDATAPAIRAKCAKHPARRLEVVAPDAHDVPDDDVPDDDDDDDDDELDFTMSDLVDEALVLTHASWHMDAFRMGLYDDCADKFLADRSVVLGCLSAC